MNLYPHNTRKAAGHTLSIDYQQGSVQFSQNILLTLDICHIGFTFHSDEVQYGMNSLKEFFLHEILF